MEKKLIDFQIKTNYHTHTNFCDGNDSPEAMVQAAIEKDFQILGFSGHSMFPYESEWHIPLNKYQAYADEVTRLKNIYKDKIKILLGFESDFYPGYVVPKMKDFEKYNIDYLIGSVHYIYFSPEKKFTVDGSSQEVAKGIEEIFHGNGKLYVQTYFDLQRQMVSSGDFQIIGHCDLVRKRNSILHFFDESEDWYKRELESTALAFAHSGKIVEINTGGMARGALQDTYPSDYFLSLLKKYDIPIMINSDAHSIDTLDFGYDFAQNKACKAGFSALSIV